MSHNPPKRARPERPLYADPTLEAAHRCHEAQKRRAQHRRDPAVILRKQRRIQRLLREVFRRPA